MAYEVVTFNSGDELPAASLTKLMANIAALKDGSALDANIVTATLIDLITRSGWLPTTALTRTADTTVTLVGDWTDRIPVGAKLRWLSAGSMRQNYVTAVSYASGTGLTTLTISPGYITTASPNDSCFKSGEAITVPQFSLADNPVGFPYSFALSAKERLHMDGGLATIFGWNYITGDGNGQTSATLTFTRAFSAIYSCVSEAIGFKANSAPATMAECTGVLGAAGTILDYSSSSVRVSSFVATLTRSSGTNATLYIGYSYEAKGILS
jgi:hypothetical protein